ncbi:MAG: hypothetical protein ACNYPE_00120 [Candidatus Azotimanducaceae bacterium WSBS_2022_MAG_OTU7]
MSRYLASFYHFLISLAVFVVLAYLILVEWYPGILYTIDGGWEGMRIIIGVDLVLGPLLTLIVFKSGKPGLKFDLAVIALVQSSCLLAGTFVVYDERPLALVYYDKRFYTVSADTFADYDRPVPEFQGQDLPVYLYSEVPEDPIEKADFLNERHLLGQPAWIYEPTYRPMDLFLERIIEQGFPIEDLWALDLSGQLAMWVEEHGEDERDYAFYPVKSRYNDGFIVIHRANKEIIDVISIKAPTWH